VVFVFLWKNVGFNVVLFVAGLNMIPKEYYECAAVEGAGRWKQFRLVTIIYILPAAFLAFVMDFVNSFRAFREIYLLAGRYPDMRIYMLQHFMYNQFANVNYQRLAASSYIVTIAFVLIVVVFFTVQRKISENF